MERHRKDTGKKKTWESNTVREEYHVKNISTAGGMRVGVLSLQRRYSRPGQGKENQEMMMRDPEVRQDLNNRMKTWRPWTQAIPQSYESSSWHCLTKSARQLNSLSFITDSLSLSR